MNESEMCLSKLPKPCVSQLLPLKVSPSLLSRLIWTWGTALAEVLRGYTLRKEASAGDSSTSEPGFLVTLPWSSRSEGQPPLLGGTRDSGSSQGKPDSAGLTGVSMKGTSWPVSIPPQSSSRTQVYSGSKNELLAQVKEVAGYKLVIPFL